MRVRERATLQACAGGLPKAPLHHFNWPRPMHCHIFMPSSPFHVCLHTAATRCINIPLPLAPAPPPWSLPPLGDRVCSMHHHPAPQPSAPPPCVLHITLCSPALCPLPRHPVPRPLHHSLPPTLCPAHHTLHHGPPSSPTTPPHLLAASGNGIMNDVRAYCQGKSTPAL